MIEESISAWVCKQIAAHLHIPLSEVCLDSTFAEIGGNSLLAVQLSASCRENGVCLSVEAILGSPRISALLECAVRSGSLVDQAAAPSMSCTPDETINTLSGRCSDVGSIASVGSDLLTPSSSEGIGTSATEMQLALIHGTQRFPSRNIINYVETHPTHRLSTLREAWKTVICMESVFRTKFDLRKGGQLVEQPDAVFNWMEETVPDAETYKTVLQTRLTDPLWPADSGCDLMVGNQIHVITRVDDDGTELSTIIWRVHHALIDGYSAFLLLRKVRDVAAGVTVKPSPSFAVVLSSLNRLRERGTIEAETFWRKQHEAYPTASGQLLLKSPTVTDDSSGTVSFQIPVDVEAVARKSGVTGAAICYAAWALTMTLFTDSDTVVFGAVLSGRNLPVPDMDQAIGPLMNTLPMYLHVDSRLSIKDFLMATFKQLVELSSFQWTLPEHGYSRHFTSALSMQFDMSGFDAEHPMNPIEEPYSLTETDIPISIFIETDWTVRIQYNHSEFQREDMEILRDHYQHAFTCLSRPSDILIEECFRSTLVPEGERLLRDLGNWDSPSTHFISVKDTLTTLFERTASQYPDDIAVEKGDTRLTYAQLRANAEMIAKRIAPFLQPGDVVCVHADRSLEWISGIYGVLLAGAVYCPLDANLPQALRDDYYMAADAKVFLTPSQSATNLRPASCINLVSIAEILNGPERKDSSSGACTQPDLQANAYLCFTSGSTGKPKGVICTHAGLVAFQNDWTVRLKAQPGWKIAQTMSPAFDGSIHEIFSALSYGATLVLPHSADPFQHLSTVDACILTPSIAKVLDMGQMQSLSTIYLVGEPVPPALNDRLSLIKEVYNMYGPTEGTGGATIKRLLPSHPVTIGPPNPSTRIYIMNQHLQLVPPGVVGEICIAGVQVARGYIGRPVETAERFFPDPILANSGENMYRTGDYGYWDVQTKDLVCLGRKDRIVKLRGFRLDLNDLEIRISRAHRAVSAVAISTAEDFLIAMVTPESIDTVELMSRLRQVLPSHALPKYIIAVEKLPVTPAGKLDYKAVAEARPRHIITDLPVRSHTATESRVINIWRSLLGLDGQSVISLDSNFLELGGHSILQLHLATALTDEFSCRVPVRLVVEFPTLQQMAQAVDHLVRQNTLRNKDTLLSPIEQEWWHKYQLGEGSCSFNVCCAVHFDPGRVDQRLLAAAWNTVLMRHRILRSRYVHTRRAGVRRQYADCPPQVERLDKFNLWNEANRPFQLDRNSPIRVMMSRDTLLVVVSHIVCDLTTLELLNQEVMSLYHGEPLPETKHEYMQVVSQNTMTAGCDLDFWAQALQNAPGPRTLFETESSRSSYRGSSIVVDIPSKTFTDILDLARQHRMTLHQIALAATALTMQMDKDPVDIILGGPHLNRKTSAATKTIGLFLEPLPIRIQYCPADHPTVAEFLKTVKTSSQQALGHAVPWNQLLRHQGTPLDYPNHPLFDIMVTFHDNRGKGTAPWPAFSPTHIWAQGSKFKLMFEFSASDKGLTLRIEHAYENYPTAVVRKIAALAAGALSLLTEEELYLSVRSKLWDRYHGE
ncbi:BcNRPS1, nonribosomal peptide synthetase [Aspergillus floccosus]